MFNYARKRDNEEELKRQKERVRIEGLWRWDWDLVLLSPDIVYNLNMQLWKNPCRAHLFGQIKTCFNR
jgi:hypothetical protein